MTEPLRLVVVADSTSFIDGTGPQLPDTPHLYPQVVARRLAEELDRTVDLQVLSRAGRTVRDAWDVVGKDRHAQFEVLAHADAVILGVGSFDHAPGGVPAWVGAVTPFLRPDSLRRRARRLTHAAYPVIVRATDGRLRRTPAREFERLFELLCSQVRGLTRGAPTVVLGPTSHRSAYYGHRHPGHADGQALQFSVADRHGMATLAVWPLVEPHADRLNPDGIHWPATAHQAVGEAAAEALLAQLTGRAPTPMDPWQEFATET